MARNNTIRNIIGIVLIAISLGGVIWGFARGSAKIDENVVNIVEVKEDIKTVDEKATTNKETLIDLTANVKHIVAGQKDMKLEMKERFDKQEKMQRDILKAVHGRNPDEL